MIIKNETANKGTKVLFFGPYKILPDKEEDIPDYILYELEKDKTGKPTGKKVMLPAIKSQIRMGLISVKETAAPAKRAPKQEAEPVISTEPVVEEPEELAEEVPEEDVEAKKAAIAAKRAATRAANRAKKDAAE